MRTVFIAIVVLVIFGVYGWVQNIITVVHSGPVAEWGGLVIVRVIGIFAAPLGAVLGYF